MTSLIIEKTAEVDDDRAEKMAALPHLVGMPLEDMKKAMSDLGIEPFRAKQIWQWIYTKGVTDFANMHNIKKDTQALLAQHFSLERAGISRNAVSFDQTQKWLLKFADAQEVETVFIPDAPRGTLCACPAQVGCTLACTFCHTGTQRLVRNLTASEIITQVLVARDGLNEWPGKQENAAAKPHKPNAQKERSDWAVSTPVRQLTNIVFMGMGEPLYNYNNVVAACKLMMDGDGLALSRRKITVSTSGVVPKMRDLARDVGVNLAVSLHAVTDELRNVIVPINRKYPIAELMEACRDYHKMVPSRHIMFEYVMLDGVNDSQEDAAKLVELLKGIPSKVNLIPFNPWPGAPYKCSSNNRIHAFGRVLMAAGIATPIRKTRGEDIMAACGQLKSMSELKKGQKVKL